MTARTHDLAAITALGLVVLARPIESVTLSTLCIALLANQIGGIVPDIDQPTAPFWRNLPVGRLFGKVFDTLIGGHRFISHSLLGVVLFSFLANVLLHFLQPIMPHTDVQLVWYAFVIGLVSHLIMDTLTKEGVPWLLPIPVKFGIPPLKRLRVTTGKWEEHFVILPILVGVDVWLLASHYVAIVAFIHRHIN
jgi:inner membrane protein